VAGESLRERLAGLSRAELVALVAVVAVTVGGAALWYSRSLPKPVEVRSSASVGASGVGGAAVASPTPSPTAILVDVAGWVRRPGVYEFVEGDRVVDAIDAAGGARSGAVLSSLNLAAPLVDGSQVLVPKEASTASGTVPVGTSGGAVEAGPINVNTATATQLEELPGVGEVIAQAIVDYRTENGPFASVDALLDVSGIGDATLANIRDLVTV
jgi:competence protein ComEA